MSLNRGPTVYKVAHGLLVTVSEVGRQNGDSCEHKNYGSTLDQFLEMDVLDVINELLHRTLSTGNTTIDNRTNYNNTTELQYNDHVIVVPLPLPSAPIWDGIIGALLLVCLVMGTAGNTIAVRYFSVTGINFAHLLYTMISVVDLLTSVSYFPISICLFTKREPGIFNNFTICAGWTIIFRFLQKISTFLVMIMSVYRAFLIALPFHKVKTKGIIFSVVFYVMFLVIIDAIMTRDYKYLSVGPFCVDSPLADGGNTTVYFPWDTVHKTLTTIELGVPSIIAFFSFITCVYKLSRPCDTAFQSERNKRAAVTVAIFTGVFLFCNLPFFTLMVLNTITRTMGFTYPDPFFRGIFMDQYSWLLAKILLTAVNASLNPVIYYYRFKKTIKLSVRARDSISMKELRRGSRGKYICLQVPKHASLVRGNEKSTNPVILTENFRSFGDFLECAAIPSCALPRNEGIERKAAREFELSSENSKITLRSKKRRLSEAHFISVTCVWMSLWTSLVQFPVIPSIFRISSLFNSCSELIIQMRIKSQWSSDIIVMSRRGFRRGFRRGIAGVHLLKLAMWLRGYSRLKKVGLSRLIW
eukprot:sb/3463325/